MQLAVAFFIDTATARCYFATMTKTDVAKMIGVTSRQHIDFVLAGKRNFSFPVAKNATAVIGGTLGLWQDKSRSEERRLVWKNFMDAAKVSSEEV